MLDVISAPVFRTVMTVLMGNVLNEMYASADLLFGYYIICFSFYINSVKVLPFSSTPCTRSQFLTLYS